MNIWMWNLFAEASSGKARFYEYVVDADEKEHAKN